MRQVAQFFLITLLPNSKNSEFTTQAIGLKNTAPQGMAVHPREDCNRKHCNLYIGSAREALSFSTDNNNLALTDPGEFDY